MYSAVIPGFLKGCSGFSLMELLVTISLISILSALALPWCSDIQQGIFAQVQINQLSRAINQAKHAAISHASVVTLCKSVDKQHCGGAWHDGQILFLDKNANAKIDPGEDVLMTFERTPAHGDLQWHGFQSKDYLQFSPLGFGYSQNGSFIYTPGNGDKKYQRRLIINRAGRLRVKS